MKTILVDAVHALIVEEQGTYVPYQEMLWLLETFPERKVILTNANDTQMVVFGLDKAPYEVFTLKQNPTKVSPDYYKRMLEALSLKAVDVVYFEHSPDAVQSARSVGIDTYFYDSEKRDLQALESYLKEKLAEV